MSSDRLIHLRAPLQRDEARALKLGDFVVLDGELVTSAGYPCHQRIIESIEGGRALPIDITNGSLVHLGSLSREMEGRLAPVYVNPTTSTRFNAFMPRIIRHFGLTTLGGKGGLDAACVAAMRDTGTVYFSMVGGASALLSDGVKALLETGWDDLIMQFRLSRFRVESFGPLTVTIDAHGNSLYDQLSAAAAARRPEIARELAAARAKAQQG